MQSDLRRNLGIALILVSASSKYILNPTRTYHTVTFVTWKIYYHRMSIVNLKKVKELPISVLKIKFEHNYYQL